MMDYEQLDEQEAIKRCLNGESAAYAAIVRRYQQEALRFTFLITGERGAAEDAAQDAFLSVYLHLRRYDPSRPFRAWLYKILSNAALKKRRKPQPEPLTNDTPANDDPQAQAASHEQSETMRLALAKLLPPQRTALVLKYYCGFNETEIATITSVSVGTVKSRLHYAKIALAHIIRDRYPWLADDYSPSLILNKEALR